MTILPITAVIATRNRSAALVRMAESLLKQELWPAEFIVIDASADERSKIEIENLGRKFQVLTTMRWNAAEVCGAAAQRNQGFRLAREAVIWFLDDDIVFEPHCVERLWNALQSDAQIGGVNAMIVNQTYGAPGFVSRLMFRIMNGKTESSYAGRVIGPAINLLPEDRDNLPELVPVDWLNTTCTMYRRAALPEPPFSSHFTGYSLMEDLALSLEIGRNWKLANARTARVVHESQSRGDKTNVKEFGRMELVNRHFVMRQTMRRNRLGDYAKLALWELFSCVSMAKQRRGLLELPDMVAGKIAAVADIMRDSKPK